MNFDIILAPTTRSSKSSLFLRSPHPNPVCTPPLLHTCYMPYSPHSVHYSVVPISSQRYTASSNGWWSFILLVCFVYQRLVFSIIVINSTIFIECHYFILFSLAERLLDNFIFF
jgi:hypothetical protein